MAIRSDERASRSRGRIVFHVVTKRWGLRFLVGAFAVAALAAAAIFIAPDSLGRWQPSVAVLNEKRVVPGAETRLDQSVPDYIDAEADEPAIPVLAGVGVGERFTEVSPVQTHPYDLLRLERERNRSRQAETWQRIAGDTTLARDTREAAALDVERLWGETQRETEIEHLLELQGYRAVANVADGRVHIVVDALLDEAAAGRIGELVARVAGVGREAVTIVDSFSPGG